MKKIMLGLLALIIAGGPVSASLMDGLVGHWTMDETLEDASPTEADGTYVGSDDNPTFIDGQIGQALLLSQPDHKVNVGQHAAHHFGADTDFSMAGWFRWDGDTDDTYYTIMGRKMTRGTNRPGYLAYLVYAGGQIRLTLNIYDGEEVGGTYNADTALTAGEWHHFAMTLDRSGDALIYLDGVLDRAAVDISGIGNIDSDQDVTQNFMIGSAGNSGERFNGALDDLGVWNRVLTPEEVTFLSTGNVIPEPSALALWALGAGLFVLLRATRHRRA